MDARYRSIGWEASTARGLPNDVRAVPNCGASGRSPTYAVDLAGFGAPAELLSLACRAALDEVRHAEIFARLAGLYSDEDETPSAGAEAMPDDPSLPLDHQRAKRSISPLQPRCFRW